MFVRGGKGLKDRVVFIGPTTTRPLKTWLARHPAHSPESFLFCGREGRPVKYRHLVQILHRLSQKAGLPTHRRLHPHALRHFATTSWLRGGADLQRAHRKARAIERPRLD